MKSYLTTLQVLSIMTQAIKHDIDNLEDCIKENDTRKAEPHYLDMLEDLITNDPVHFSVLSAGCQAAMIITLHEEGRLEII